MSDAVLDAVAQALPLDTAETSHLFDLARGPRTRRKPAQQRVRPGVQQRLLDAMSGVPAFARAGRS